MKIKVLVVFLMTVYATSSFAFHMNRCFNSDSDTLSTRFVNCVNQNFEKLAKILTIRIETCEHYNDGVDPIFASCVKDNFKTVATRLHTTLPACDDFDYESLPLIYSRCVNNNFVIIETEMM